MHHDHDAYLFGPSACAMVTTSVRSLAMGVRGNLSDSSLPAHAHHGTASLVLDFPNPARDVHVRLESTLKLSRFRLQSRCRSDCAFEIRTCLQLAGRTKQLPEPPQELGAAPSRTEHGCIFLYFELRQMRTLEDLNLAWVRLRQAVLFFLSSFLSAVSDGGAA